MVTWIISHEDRTIRQVLFIASFLALIVQAIAQSNGPSITTSAASSGNSSFYYVLLSGGGSLGSNSISRSPDGINWTPLTPVIAPFPLITETQLVAIAPLSSNIQNIILLFGGSTGNTFKLGTATNDCWASMDIGSTWVNLAKSTSWPSPRVFHSIISVSPNVVILCGGASSYSGGSYYNDCWSSTASLNNNKISLSFTFQGNGLFSPRNLNGNMQANNQIIYIAGGWNGGALNDIWSNNNFGLSSAWLLINANGGFLGVTSGCLFSQPNLNSLVLTTGYSASLSLVNTVYTFNSTANTNIFTLTSNGAPFSVRRNSACITDFSSNTDNTTPLPFILFGGSTMTDIWKSVDNAKTWQLLVSSIDLLNNFNITVGFYPSLVQIQVASGPAVTPATVAPQSPISFTAFTASGGGTQSIPTQQFANKQIGSSVCTPISTSGIQSVQITCNNDGSFTGGYYGFSSCAPNSLLLTFSPSVTGVVTNSSAVLSGKTYTSYVSTWFDITCPTKLIPSWTGTFSSSCFNCINNPNILSCTCLDHNYIPQSASITVNNCLSLQASVDTFGNLYCSNSVTPTTVAPTTTAPTTAATTYVPITLSSNAATGLAIGIIIVIVVLPAVACICLISCLIYCCCNRTKRAVNQNINKMATVNNNQGVYTPNSLAYSIPMTNISQPSQPGLQPYQPPQPDNKYSADSRFQQQSQQPQPQYQANPAFPHQLQPRPQPQPYQPPLSNPQYQQLTHTTHAQSQPQPYQPQPQKAQIQYSCSTCNTVSVGDGDSKFCGQCGGYLTIITGS